MNWLVLIIAGIISFTASTSPEMYREERDAIRLSDLGAIKGALILLLTTADNPNICPQSSKNKVYRSDQGTSAVDGTGWLPVNLTKTTGGSPFSYFPKDPTNNEPYIYTYSCDPTSQRFEFNVKMESTRYQNGGMDDVESTDAGDNAHIFETGTAPGLPLLK